MCFLVSWLNPPPLPHPPTPITLYLIYLLPFDPVLRLFSVLLDVESILASFLCSLLLLPTIYSTSPALVACKLTTGILWTCARTVLAPRPQNGQHACIWPVILSWMDGVGTDSCLLEVLHTR